MIYRILTFVAMLAFYGPQVSAQVDQGRGTDLSVLAGAGVSMSDESAPIPRIQLRVDSPAFLGQDGDAFGRIRVDLDLSGLPGSTINLTDVTTWTSAELRAELQRVIGKSGGFETLIVGSAGFITRVLPGDETPRQRFARVYAAGIRAQHREDDGSVSRSVALMYGRSEVASPDVFDKGQIYVQGHVRVTDASGVEVWIVGDAHLTVGRGTVYSPVTGLPAERRDVMRLSVMAGWGKSSN